MNDKLTGIFKILFIISIFYHIWSFTQYGFDAFAIVNSGNLILTIIASSINYLIQIGLPLLFLYIGFIKRNNSLVESKPKEDPKPESSFYPKSTLK
jgi:hypothetical protein